MLKPLNDTTKTVVYTTGQSCLKNPRPVKVDGEDMLGFDVEQPYDGFSDLCDAMTRLANHPRRGDIAYDVLAHLAYKVDPWVAGLIIERINLDMEQMK
jgi:hypothetical protein